ncbi:MAG: hydrolase 1, exosortase A system-associated [Motiliproteus sp.]|nr:hydrolase 1, exosortase A system-associated [Motiliproteus sp.]MCW9053173.1 hydrolase 1, exosortase A system-associated [Motiliproteus sp.]
MNEQPITFSCNDQLLTGIIHHAEPVENSTFACDKGILIIVGGPQYRVGSHRQFIQLARSLAKLGISSMRFDITGMGDSTGLKKSFDQMDEDIRCALDCFSECCSQAREFVLWGLCDSASASLIYGCKDARVSDLILINPWLENDASKAQAEIKGYYAKRLLSKSFWTKLVSGDVRIFEGVANLSKSLLLAAKGPGSEPPVSEAEDDPDAPYQERMRRGYLNFKGNVLLILSGNDLTAKEFELQFFGGHSWYESRAKETVEINRLAEADHTFSAKEQRFQVESMVADFVLSSD